MVVAVDFDGTCVTHDYPEVGKDIGAIPVLKKLAQNGHKLILYTMRDANQLNDAVNWFKQNEIPLYAKQINPTQINWTRSNKCYANLYIDDATLGCPLKEDSSLSDRPFVDWIEVEKILQNMKLI
jgi:hydroxymethylpyrimidine pyrophosphatase-like HAD family hydrolase